MKYLVAGLGNVGDDYRDTRHNIGFEVVDALADASTAVFKEGRHAFVSEVKHKGRTLVLIKPTTFMNLSGKAVNYWMQQEKIPIERLLVVVDDIALPLCKLRLRAKGSDGGHNGLKDINAVLGTNNYARLRFGIGNDFGRGQQVDFVLGKWTAEEKEQLPDGIALAQEIIQAFATNTIGRVMSDYNKR